LKVAILPIHEAEEVLAPIKKPVDSIKSRLGNTIIKETEDIWKIGDKLYPQPLEKSEIITYNSRDIALMACLKDGYPINTDATFTTGNLDTVLCENIDEIYPKRIPSRLYGPNLKEIVDYKQRKYYNKRWAVDDPLDVHKQDYVRQKLAKEIVEEH